MATSEITLRGEVRDAVIGCVARDIESSLEAVQTEYGTALQTFDCLDLLNARAQARGLADAIELLARLIDPDRVDQEIERERDFAELQEQEAAAEKEINAAEDESGVDQDSVSSWIGDVNRKTASNWVGETAKLPNFLQTPRRHDRLNDAGAP
jgi:hypothetical protein